MRVLLIQLFICPYLLLAQQLAGSDLGIALGIQANFGLHTTSLGLRVDAYYKAYFFQVNAASSLVFNIHDLGGRKHFLENKNTLGLFFFAGKKEMPVDFQFDPLVHRTAHNYGVGYNYNWYLDNAGTSQRTGTFVMHLKSAFLAHENDAFAGEAKDRFRTAKFIVGYRNEQIKLYTGIDLWTGETANSTWQRVTDPRYPYGFRILEDLPYGTTSHGIAYGGITLLGPYGQTVSFKTGVDSEQIRHLIQNRIFHDLIFLPASIKRSTPHYPRLDKNGCAVFEKNQRKPDQLYLQLGLNTYL